MLENTYLISWVFALLYIGKKLNLNNSSIFKLA